MNCNLPDIITIFGRAFTLKDMPSVSAAEGVIGMAAYHEGAIYLDRTAPLYGTKPSTWCRTIFTARSTSSKQDGCPCSCITCLSTILRSLNATANCRS
jgi:hypothetical protein